jgi:hypothetical protein
MNCSEFKELIVDYLTKKALDLNTKKEFEEHYFECDDCFNDLELTSVTIGVIHSEGIDKIFQFSTEERITVIKEKAKSLVERIKALISDTSLPCRCYGFETARSHAHKENTYNINESIVINITAPQERDGYLTIIHYDKAFNLRLIFPTNSCDTTLVKSGVEKEFGINLTGPIGKQYVKVIWTASELLNPKDVRFKNTDELILDIGRFLDALEIQEENNWMEEVLKYEVI